MDWTTIHEVVPTEHDHAITLRQHRPGNDKGRYSLVLPPQAGHGGEIADWPGESRSMVQGLLEGTAGGVGVVDWKSCTWGRRNEDYEDLVKQVHSAIRAIGGPVNLFGLCQGGTLAIIYAALNPGDVGHLIPIGCPVDPHASPSVLDRALKMPLTLYQMAVAMQGGKVSGKWMLANWKAINWEAHYIKRYTEPSAKKNLFYSWYDDARDIAGGWYLKLIEDLFLGNKLIQNKFKLFGENVNLGAIECPTDLVAGEKDNISPIQHVFALQQHVKHAFMSTVKGAGHIGCFNSVEANTVTLPEVYARMSVA